MHEVVKHQRVLHRRLLPGAQGLHVSQQLLAGMHIVHACQLWQLHSSDRCGPALRRCCWLRHPSQCQALRRSANPRAVAWCCQRQPNRRVPSDLTQLNCRRLLLLLLLLLLPADLDTAADTKWTSTDAN